MEERWSVQVPLALGVADFVAVHCSQTCLSFAHESMHHSVHSHCTNLSIVPRWAKECYAESRPRMNRCKK